MPLSEDELRRRFEAKQHEINQTGIEDFEEYSPGEMGELIYRPLESTCPVQLNKITPEMYREIPILNIARYMLTRIEEQGSIILTITGKLPVKLVADTYAQGFYKDVYIEAGIRKLYSEESAMSIELSHILLTITGMVRKSKGALRVTKQGVKLLADPHTLLIQLLVAFGQKFYMPYYDGYGENPIGRIGWSYTLILLHKYGKEWRPSGFYAEKYFKAFPTLLNTTSTGDASNSFIIRTFDRFLHFFGLVEIQNPHWSDRAALVKSTPFFSYLVDVKPPKN